MDNCLSPAHAGLRICHIANPALVLRTSHGALLWPPAVAGARAA
ncbi:MAG TPA: hypothetical protein VM943_01315 [Pyrinomonadaceae bacterium]|nr:hypothetical protein [Pyrinomonadaceae bacterium]